MNKSFSAVAIPVAKSVLGLLIGFVISLTLAKWAGENPFHVFKVLWQSGTGSADDLALTLFYSTSLMFTGLAVALSFRAGLFNIGGEGQLTWGALLPTLVALTWFQGHPDTSPVLAFFVSLLFSLLGGAFWGAIAGWLKAWRGAHEVVVTIMLNFIAAGIFSYLVVGPFQSNESQNPETATLPNSFLWTNWDPIHALAPNSPLNLSLLMALGLCLFFQWFLAATRFGFQWRVLGQRPRVADNQGIPVRRTTILVLAVSGAIAGLVGLNDVCGSAGKLRLGFSPEYGFMGIAVAMLARSQPLAVIPSAILFGLLQKGAADLDLETQVINRDFAKVIQAIVILSVIAAEYIPFERLKQSLGSRYLRGGQNE